MTDEEAHPPSSRTAPCNTSSRPVLDHSTIPPRKNIARICGSSRSRCGYCHGTRLPVLEQYDPPWSHDTNNDTMMIMTRSKKELEMPHPLVLYVAYYS